MKLRALQEENFVMYSKQTNTLLLQNIGLMTKKLNTHLSASELIPLQFPGCLYGICLSLSSLEIPQDLFLDRQAFGSIESSCNC